MSRKHTDFIWKSMPLGVLALLTVGFLLTFYSPATALPACNASTKGTLSKTDGSLVYCDGVSWGGVGASGSGGDFWQDAGSGKIYYSDAMVGVNTTDPKNALDVTGDLVTDGTITAEKITFGAKGIKLQDVPDAECAGVDDAGRVRYNSVMKRIEVCNTISFEPIDGDIVPPYLLSTAPADDSTSAGTTDNIVLTFNEPVFAETGYIIIYDSVDGSVVESIDVNDPIVTGDGTDTITIDPTSDFEVGRSYHVLMSENSYRDENDNYFRGILKDTDFNFTINDAAQPSAIVVFPSNNSTDVARNENLVITFDENVKKGSGNIYIYETATDDLFETINVATSQVTADNSTTVTINPGSNFDSLTDYYILIPSGVIKDLYGNNWGGVALKTDWHFVTEDSGPPLLTSRTPNDGAQDVSRTANLVMNFNENVNDNSGTITIHKYSDDSVIETINVPSGQVTGNGTSTITVNPSVTLDAQDHVYVRVSNTAFEDDNGNNFLGLSNKNQWDFYTADDVAPTLVSTNPIDNATDVTVDQNIVLTFSEKIAADTTAIEIRRTADDTLFESIPVTGNKIMGFGTTKITLMPDTDFESFTEYYVIIPSTSLNDRVGNDFAGISSTTDLSFTTGDGDVPTLVSTVPENNAISIDGTADFTLTFSENVSAGSGNIRIYRSIDGALIETIPAASGLVTGGGTTTITVNPATDLNGGTEFYVLIDDDAFEDDNGNAYAGLSNKWDWTFTTLYGASIWDTESPDIQAKIYPRKIMDGMGVQSSHIQGEWAAIGSPSYDGYETNGGAAFMYKFNGNSWDYHQEIVAGNYYNEGAFGFNIVIDNGYLFVSATLGQESGSPRGDVYVYQNIDDSWVQTQVLNSTDANGHFGDYGLERFGDTLLIGSHVDNVAGSEKGAIHIYRLNNGTWTLQDTLRPNASYSTTAHMGTFLTMKDDYIFAPTLDDDTNGTDQGAVAIFKFNPTTGGWDHVQKLVASDAANGDRFGWDISYDNGFLAVGAGRDDTSTGAVYVFTQNPSGDFIETQKIIPSDAATNMNFGTNIVLKNRSLIVSAANEDSAGSNRGKLYIYTYDGSAWVEQHAYQPSDLTDTTYFTRTLHYDGNKIIAAAYLDDDKGLDVGAAYIITAGDETAPYIISSSPENGSYGHVVSDDIVLTFNENVTLDTGSIFLYKDAGDELIEEFTAASPLLSGDGTNQITINPTDDLDFETRYYILIEDTVFNDANGFDFAGIADKNEFTFTTDYGVSPWEGATVNLQQKLTDPNEPLSTTRFGMSVTYNKELGKVYVSASHSNLHETLGGTVYGFGEDNGRWSFDGNYDFPVSANDGIGNDVSYSNNKIAITAVGDDTDGVDQGAVYVYKTSPNGTLDLEQKITGGATPLSSSLNDIELNGNRLIIGAYNNNSEGRVFYYEFNGTTWVQQQILSSPTPTTGGNYGTSLSIDANTLAIEERNFDPGSYTNAGAVHVYNFNGTTWDFVQTLAPDTQEDNARFGEWVKIYGDTLLAAARSEDTNGVDSGAVYVFKKQSNGQWMQTQKLVPADNAADDMFGDAVYLYKNTLIIGAGGIDNGGTSKGAIYVYTRHTQNDDFVLQTKYSPDDSVDNDNFGRRSIVIHEDKAFIGNMWNDDIEGATYIVTAGDITPPYIETKSPLDNSQSVGFNQDIVLTFTENVNAGSGSVRIYDYFTDTLIETINAGDAAISGYGTNIITINPVGEFTIGNDYYILMDEGVFVDDVGLDFAGISDKKDYNFKVSSNESYWAGVTPFLDQKFVRDQTQATSNKTGIYMVLDNEWAFVGVALDDVGGIDAGSVQIYRNENSIWSLYQTIDNPAPGSDDQFGLSIDISGNSAVIGARNDDTLGTNVGLAYIYDYNGTNWVYSQTLQPGTIENGMGFGSSASLSGNLAVVSAREENSGRGALYAYQKVAGTWSQIQKITEADISLNNSRYGFHLQMDSQNLVVGVNQNFGYAYVYSWNGAQWVFDQRLETSDPLATSTWGQTVGLYENHIIVTDSGYDSNKGAVFVFKNNGTNWVEEATLTASDGVSGDRLGFILAYAKIHQGTITVGSPYHDSAGTDVGAVYLFTYDNDTSTWSEEYKITPNDTVNELYFGVNEIYDGTILVSSGTFTSTETFHDQLWFYTAAPRIISSSPSNGSTIFGASDNMVFNFNTPVTPTGGSKMQIIKVADGSVAETVNLDGPKVSGSGTNTITIDLENTLDIGAQYYATISNSAFASDTGLYFDGISGNDGLRFTTYKTSVWEGIVPQQIEQFAYPSTSNEINHIDIDGIYAVVSNSQDNQDYSVGGSAFVYVKTNDGWEEQQRLVPSSYGANTAFGYNVDIQGDEIAVGAREADSAEGAVYIFKRSGDSWTQTQRLQPADLSAGTLFGHNVVLKGGLLAVSAPHVNGGSSYSGTIYLFKKVSGTWTEFQQLYHTNPLNWDRLSHLNVSDDNSFIVLPSPFLDGNGSDSGGAFIFERQPDGYYQQAKRFYPDDFDPSDSFGRAVTVAGDTVFISSQWKDSYTGAVYAFKKINQEWQQVQKITASDAATGTYFGNYIYARNNTLFIGSSGANKTYIFTQNKNGEWVEQTSFTGTDVVGGDFFGGAVAYQDDYALVASAVSRKIYAFSNKPASQKLEENKIVSSPRVPGGYFSIALSINNDYLAVGAHGENTFSGAAYIFKKVDQTWTQIKRIAPNDLSDNDIFGIALKLTDDYLVVAAREQNGGEGSIYIYNRSGDNFNFVKKITSPNPAGVDSFGAAIDIWQDTLVVTSLGTVGEAYIFAKDQGGTNNWGLTHTLTPSDGSNAENYGLRQVSIYDDAIVIGARNRSNGGAVYMYHKDFGGVDNWGEVKIITGSNTVPGDEFGFGFDIYDSRLIVGARSRNSKAGMAYVFERNQGGTDNWGETQIITASDTLGGDNPEFGYEVALEQTTALISSTYYNLNGDNDAGKAYEFNLINGTWTETRSLEPFDAETEDFIGISMDMSNGQYVIANVYDDIGPGDDNAGAAYVFYSSSPVIVSSTPADNATGISNDTDIAITFDRPITKDNGSIYLRKVSDDSIIETHSVNSPNVTISGTTLNIDRSGNDRISSVTDVYISIDNTAIKSGDNYFTGISDNSTLNFTTTSVWLNATATEVIEIDNPGAVRQTQFAVDLEISGDWAIASAMGVTGPDPVNHINYGKAYLFYKDQGGVDNWGLFKTFSPTGESLTSSAYFGASASLYNNWLAIGCMQCDEFGANTGAVYLYEKDQGGANNWGLVKKFAAPTSTSGDQIGSVLELYNDKLVALAYGEDDLGANSGAGYVFYKDQGGVNNWGYVQTIYPSAGWQSGYFGGHTFTSSLDLDDNYIVVGQPNVPLGGVLNAGRVEIYAKDQGGVDNWGLIKTINAPNLPTGDNNIQFGVSVSLNNNMLAVGARLEEDVYNDDGVAYIFYKDQGGVDNWGQVKRITCPIGSSGFYFGEGIDIKNNTLVITARRTNQTGFVQSGSGFVFKKDEGGADNWGYVKRILPYEPKRYGSLGMITSMNNDASRIMIGSRIATSSNGYAGGAAEIFYKDQGGTDNWGGVKDITPYGDLKGTNSFAIEGAGVDFAGDIIAVGAVTDGEGAASAGAVYIFERDFGGLGNWGVRKKLIYNDDDAYRCGSNNAIALDGDMLAVGCDGSLIDDAKVYLYGRNVGSPNGWGLIKVFSAPSPVYNGRFGESLDLKNNMLVIGNRTQGTKGTAYIYLKDEGGSNNWGLFKTLVPSASDNGQFGVSVHIADDGNRMIIGAWISNLYGTNNGTAYIFEKDYGGTDNWGEVTYLAHTPTGESTGNGDRCGFDVAINGDFAIMGCLYFTYNDGDPTSRSHGRAFLYYKDQGGANNWGQIQDLLPPNYGASFSQRQYGRAVALENDTVFVMSNSDHNVYSGAGTVYAFQRNQGGVDNWGLVDYFSTAAGDEKGGFAVNDGEIILLNPNGEVSGGIINAGTMTLFKAE